MCFSNIFNFKKVIIFFNIIASGSAVGSVVNTVPRMSAQQQLATVSRMAVPRTSVINTSVTRMPGMPQSPGAPHARPSSGLIVFSHTPRVFIWILVLDNIIYTSTLLIIP